MKVLVGIDSSSESLSSIDLMGQLSFSNLQLQLVHVIERLSPEEWANKPQNANSLLTQFLQMHEKEGKEWLDKAAALAMSYDISSEASLKYGSTIANRLLEVAQAEQVDLLAIGSRDESAFGKLLIGSVGRKLVSSSPQSLCISRNDFSNKTEPLDAVFATDHSEYAQKCVDTLLKLAPRGLRRLTILTAYPHEMVKTMRNFMPKVPADITLWLADHLEQQNLKVRERLSKLPCEIDSKVMASEPDLAMETSMQETGSRLLIMGAQGHGFLERLTTGSHTFRQAVAGKYSVLILRAMN